CDRTRVPATRCARDGPAPRPSRGGSVRWPVPAVQGDRQARRSGGPKAARLPGRGRSRVDYLQIGWPSAAALLKGLMLPTATAHSTPGRREDVTIMFLNCAPATNAFTVIVAGTCTR